MMRLIAFKEICLCFLSGDEKKLKTYSQYNEGQYTLDHVSFKILNKLQEKYA